MRRLVPEPKLLFRAQPNPENIDDLLAVLLYLPVWLLGALLNHMFGSLGASLGTIWGSRGGHLGASGGLLGAFLGLVIF